jgi:hypothetical protein
MLCCRFGSCGRGRIAFFILILSSVLAVCFPFSARADQAGQSVTLAWDASSDPDVAGYKVYYGGASRAYTNCVDAGNVTQLTIYGLIPGATYYFAATTYDRWGNESDFSNEATFQAPPAAGEINPILTSAISAGGQFGFTVSGPAGSLQVVQASTNLVDWVSVQTNLAPFTFVENNSAGFKQRFFRTFSLPL